MQFLTILNVKLPKFLVTNRSFGKLCTPPDQKWKAIFRQFYQILGFSETNDENSSKTSTIREMESQKLWQNVAAIISKSQRSHQKRSYFNNNVRLISSFSPKKDETSNEHEDQLNRILQFDDGTLSSEVYEQIHAYLIRAFESPHHPLGLLLNELAAVYTATYGGVRVHPLLLEHAVTELTSITTRVYEIVTLFFPNLPKSTDESVIKTDSEQCNEE